MTNTMSDDRKALIERLTQARRDVKTVQHIEDMELGSIRKMGVIDQALTAAIAALSAQPSPDAAQTDPESDAAAYIATALANWSIANNGTINLDRRLATICDYAERYKTGSKPDAAPAVAQREPKCPECGGDELGTLPEFGTDHRYCLKCKQEFFTTIDYTKPSPPDPQPAKNEGLEVVVPDELLRQWYDAWAYEAAHNDDLSIEKFVASRAIAWDRQQRAQPPGAAEASGGPSPLPERDTSKPAEQQGLFRKFVVTRTDGSDKPGGKHEGCEYFVLDVKHDQHAPAALLAYAVACKATHPDLAKDMLDRYELAPAEPQQAQGEQSDYDAAMDRIGDSVQGLAHALGMQDVDGDESAETIICRWLEHVTEVAKASNLKFDGNRIVPADQSGSAPVADSATTGPAVDQADGKVRLDAKAAQRMLDYFANKLKAIESQAGPHNSADDAVLLADAWDAVKFSVDALQSALSPSQAQSTQALAEGRDG